MPAPNQMPQSANFAYLVLLQLPMTPAPPSTVAGLRCTRSHVLYFIHPSGLSSGQREGRAHVPAVAATVATASQTVSAGKLFGSDFGEAWEGRAHFQDPATTGTAFLPLSLTPHSSARGLGCRGSWGGGCEIISVMANG